MNSISENNANMTLVRPDMAILLGAKLPMSSFGLLALSFSQQIAERASCISAAHPMFSLEYLKDEESEATPTVISPVLNLDFSFILDQMRKLDEQREKAAPEKRDNTVIYVDNRKTVTSETVYRSTHIQQASDSTGNTPQPQLRDETVKTITAGQDTSAFQRNSAACVMRLVERAASMQRSGWGQPSLGKTAMGRDIRVITMPVQGSPGRTIRQFSSEIVPAASGELFFIEDKTAADGAEQPSDKTSQINIETNVSSAKKEIIHKADAHQKAKSEKSVPEQNGERRVIDVLPESGQAARVASYLPERPQNTRRITPAGVWKPADTVRGPMTSPQMEMLFSNVIRAEQEMGLTYGKNGSGIPFAPQDRTQYLKQTSQLIQRREALAEAVYQIPPSALPAQELSFLQELAEQPGTSEQILSAAEQVVGRALELLAESASAAVTVQQTAAHIIPPPSAEKGRPAAAELSADSHETVRLHSHGTFDHPSAPARRSNASAPTELSFPAVPTATGTSDSPASANTLASATEEILSQALQKIVSVPDTLRQTAAEPAQIPHEPETLSAAVGIRADGNQIEAEKLSSVSAAQTFPDRQPSSVSPQELSYLIRTAESENAAEPDPVKPIISAAEDAISRTLKEIITESPEVRRQNEAFAPQQTSDPNTRGAVGGGIPASPSARQQNASSEAGSVAAPTVPQAASVPVELSYAAQSAESVQNDRPAAAETLIAAAEAFRSSVKRSRAESEASPASHSSDAPNAPEASFRIARTEQSHENIVGAIPFRAETAQRENAAASARTTASTEQRLSGTSVELSYLEQPDIFAETHPVEAAVSHSAAANTGSLSAASKAAETVHAVRQQDIIHSFSVHSEAPEQMRPRLKILQRIRTVFRGSSGEPAAAIETAAYPPVELVDQQAGRAADSRPLLMRDEQFRNSVQLLERIVSRTVSIRAPEQLASVMRTPITLSEEINGLSTKTGEALPTDQRAETAYLPQPEAGMTIPGNFEKGRETLAQIPMTAAASAETAYLPHREAVLHRPESAASVPDAHADTPELPMRHSGFFRGRESRSEARKNRKGNRSNQTAIKSEKRVLPSADVPDAVPAAETVYLEQSASKSVPAVQTPPDLTASAKKMPTTQPLQMKKPAASRTQTIHELQTVKSAENLPEEPVYLTRTEHETKQTQRRQTIERERYTQRVKTSVVRQPPIREKIKTAQPPEIHYINVPTAIPANQEQSSQKHSSAPAQQAFLNQQAMKSDYVQNLPEWAKNFLQNGYDEKASNTAPKEPTGIPASNQISWTNPSAEALRAKSLPPQEIDLMQKQEKEAAPVQISESELRRTADRVYKIIEDRLRSERRRHGW